jgi:phosphoheptose isomerase
MDASYLAELIFAWQKTESTNQIVISEVEENAMIVVELTGKDADMAKKLADAVQGIIQKYQGECR